MRKIAGCDAFCQSEILQEFWREWGSVMRDVRTRLVRNEWKSVSGLAQIAEAGLEDAQRGDGGGLSP